MSTNSRQKSRAIKKLPIPRISGSTPAASTNLIALYQRPADTSTCACRRFEGRHLSIERLDCEKIGLFSRSACALSDAIRRLQYAAPSIDFPNRVRRLSLRSCRSKRFGGSTAKSSRSRRDTEYATCACLARSREVTTGPWARLFTIIATSSLVPLEAYEIAREVHALRVLILLLNVAVVVYLAPAVKKSSLDYAAVQGLPTPTRHTEKAR